MNKRKWKEPLFALAFVLTAALMLNFAAAVLRPAHTDYGSTWEAYLAEPEDSIDVLFFGSSYAYCDWNPGAMYAESGLTGYVLGGSEQTPAITYWYLKEALKTQTPSVVVMEASSLYFDRYQNYTQTNIGYMPWGLDRVGAILDAAEPDKRLGLFFDLYFYHDRWKELTPGDVRKALIPAGADHLKGHTAVDQIYDRAGEGPAVWDMRQSQAVYDQNIQDFGRIAQVCREAGIPLILMVNPTYSQYTPEVYAKLETDVKAVAPEVTFVNWADRFEAFDLDPLVHLYDGGHLNREGAKIFSAYTGSYLRSLGYQPREQTAENAAAWGETAAFWTGAGG